jgi:hypothetical protein
LYFFSLCFCILFECLHAFAKQKTHDLSLLMCNVSPPFPILFLLKLHSSNLFKKKFIVVKVRLPFHYNEIEQLLVRLMIAVFDLDSDPSLLLIKLVVNNDLLLLELDNSPEHIL